MTTGINYLELQAVATDLLTSSGKPLILRRTSAGRVADPVLGTVTQGADVDTPTYGVIDTINQDFMRRLGAANVKVEDRMALLKPLPTVLLGDTVVEVDSGKVWRVVTLNLISPSGIDLLYEVQLRP